MSILAPVEACQLSAWHCVYTGDLKRKRQDDGPGLGRSSQLVKESGQG